MVSERVSNLSMGQLLLFSFVRAFIFDNEYNLKKRIDAKKAVLKKGKLNFMEAYYSTKNDLMEYKTNIEIDTAITVGKLFNSITFPEHLNMFELPKFIRNINDAGFPAISHKLYFYQQLMQVLYLTGL